MENQHEANTRGGNRRCEMKKALVLPLTDKELQEVYRILIDRDKDAAWEFLNEYARAPLLNAMTGG
jgi:hypothetical protein